MKKNLARLSFCLLAACLLLALAGCGDNARQTERGRIDVYWVNGLPDEKWLYLETPGSDDVVREFNFAHAYYYNDTDYLLCAHSYTRAGQQHKIVRAAAGAEPEIVCVWPENSLHEYTDFISSYYLPVTDEVVLYNQQQHRFLVYANAAGTAREMAPPVAADTEIWLGGGRYLLCHVDQDEKELHRITAQISLYDQAVGTEQPLAELTNARLTFVPPDAEHPDRWLLLSGYGELLELNLSADGGEAQVRLRSCREEWPASSDWLYYGDIQPVAGREDCFVWQVECEDGEHYQAVDLAAGRLLGEYAASRSKGGGLIGAQGDKLYVSEYYYAMPPEDSCKIIAYDYAAGQAEQILGTARDDLHSLYPNEYYQEHSTDNYFIGAGAVSPDGRELLLFDAGYVISVLLD